MEIKRCSFTLKIDCMYLKSALGQHLGLVVTDEQWEKIWSDAALT